MLNFTDWLEQVSPASPLAFGLVALAGLVMGLAPSSLPLYSVVMGTVAARRDSGEHLGRFLPGGEEVGRLCWDRGGGDHAAKPAA